jgi:murein DD-endopeptidase MepM/ murein hydrolase activator NlpD
MFTKNHNKLIYIFFSSILLISTTGLSLGEKFNNSSCVDIPLYQAKDSVSFTVSDSDFINLTKNEVLYKLNITWPVLDPFISSGYGDRRSCNKCSTFHQGLDFTPGRGDPVVAAIDGTVVEVRNANEYGLFVVIEHEVLFGGGQTWHTVYAHLQDGSVPSYVYPGAKVNLGDQIGRVGSTGLTTGPHLHFEIQIDGRKVNPLPIFKKYLDN